MRWTRHSSTHTWHNLSTTGKTRNPTSSTTSTLITRTEQVRQSSTNIYELNNHYITGTKHCVYPFLHLNRKMGKILSPLLSCRHGYQYVPWEVSKRFNLTHYFEMWHTSWTQLFPNESYSFHARLKTNYLNGKVNRRVDFLLDALLKIERDSFFKIMTNHRLANLNKREIRQANRHQSGLEIKAEDATMSKITYIFIYSLVCSHIHGNILAGYWWQPLGC